MKLTFKFMRRPLSLSPWFKSTAATIALLAATSAQCQPATFDIELSLPSHSGHYHNPYTAIWVEDPKGKSVRTLVLWREQAKWLKDLRRWWRKTGRKNPELVDAITSATRPTGNYHLQFAANDDQGIELPSGEYRLCIEVVREHGGRSMVKKPFNLNGHPLSMEIEPSLELAPSQFKITYKDLK